MGIAVILVFLTIPAFAAWLMFRPVPATAPVEKVVLVRTRGDAGPGLPGLIDPPPGLLSAAAFKALVALEIRKRDDSLVATEIDPLAFSLSIGDGEDPIEVFIGNYYREYLAEPAKLDVLLINLADVAMAGVAQLRGKAFDGAADQLAVVLRHKDYLKYLDREKSLWEPFYGDLIALAVFCRPGHMVNATRETVMELNIEPDEVWAYATENMNLRFEDLNIIVEKNGAKVFSAFGGIAPGYLWLLSKKADRPDFIAMVINRDNYIYADMDDEMATQTLAGIAAKFVEERNTLSDNLVSCFEGNMYASRLDGDRWLPCDEETIH